MDLYEDSPITQRSASTRLDLPQPFGPTTPVSPGSIRKSVGSTNDLNPIRRSRVSFMRQVSSRALIGSRLVVHFAESYFAPGIGPVSWISWAWRDNESSGAIEQQLVTVRRRFSRPFGVVQRQIERAAGGRRRPKNPYQPLR